MKNVFIISIILFLTGCASKQMGLENVMFDQKFIDSISNHPEQEHVIYKSYSMDYGDWGVIHENFVITNSGVYVVNWNYGFEKFIAKYKFNFENIKDIKLISEEEEAFLGVNPAIIQITDTSNKIYTFTIHNNSALSAEKIINSKIKS